MVNGHQQGGKDFGRLLDLFHHDKISLCSSKQSGQSKRQSGKRYCLELPWDYIIVITLTHTVHANDR
jgi:hypothetical protein